MRLVKGYWIDEDAIIVPGDKFMVMEPCDKHCTTCLKMIHKVFLAESIVDGAIWISGDDAYEFGKCAKVLNTKDFYNVVN